MGFDNECILNIQSLAGEYFCSVCRLLVYPNEALQSQCTHLYCKPCLTYVVSTTRACPYDGYLVTDADSKALVRADSDTKEVCRRRKACNAKLICNTSTIKGKLANLEIYRAKRRQLINKVISQSLWVHACKPLIGMWLVEMITVTVLIKVYGNW